MILMYNHVSNRNWPKMIENNLLTIFWRIVITIFYQAYNEKSHKADDYIRMIEARLDQAVSQCISAAGALFQPTHQKQLMRAAKFGNSFLQVKILIICYFFINWFIFNVFNHSCHKRLWLFFRDLQVTHFINNVKP